MNTIQLECFVAVAEHLNFSKASLALKLTQPAVSHQIQAVLGVREESKKISLSFHEICSVPFTCICSPDHPLAQYRALTTAQLEGNFIACSPRQISDSIFRIHSNIMTSLPPENRLFNESIEGALALVKAKMGYTLYPDIQASREPDLCYIPVTNLPKISFGVYCQYRNRQPVLKRFLTLLEQSIRKEHS